MKIVKHCTDHSPSLVTGQLLGLDIGATLEVTDCFPFPSAPVGPAADEDVDPDAGADYQLEIGGRYARATIPGHGIQTFLSH